MLSFMRTDAGLVQSVLAGRVDRFDELMRRHFNTAYGIAFSYTQNHADAEDLCQDAFLKAYQSLDKLDKPKKFGHWLSVITRNLARTWYQRRSREGEVLLELPKPQADSARYDDMRELLTNQIQDLEPIPREVLMRHYFAGQTTGEIAKSMGVSQAAVLKRLQRAREALGAKLIHELKLIPAAEPGSAERRRKIMGAITATGLTWKMGTGSAVAGVLVNARVIAGIAIVVGAGGFAAYNATTDPEPGGGSAAMAIPADTASETQTPLTAPANETPVPETEMQTTEASTNDDATASFQLAQAADEDDAESVPIAPVDSDGEISFDGDWRLLIGTMPIDSTDEPQQPERVGIMRIKQKGDTFQGSGLAEIMNLMRAEGQIDDRNVTVNFYLVDQEQVDRHYGALTGELSENNKQIDLIGEINPTGVPSDAVKVIMNLERIDPTELQPEDVRELAERRLNAIFEAIKVFTEATGNYPASLSDLTEDYLPDQTHLLTDARQELTYSLPTYNIDEVQNRILQEAVKLKSWEHFQETKNPGFIIDWEEDLAAIWGDYFPGGFEILHYVDRRHSFALSMSDRGTIRVEATEGQNGDNTARQRARDAQVRASCANNLKQLGLSFKMFENETHGGYIPAGFRHIYPEYLADPIIVTCPDDEVGTISFTVLYPASNRDDWIAIYEAVNGPIDDDSPDKHVISLSSLPWIIEADHCADGLGRNVLFGDGHVEYIKDDAWDQRIGPYLKYAY